MAIAPPIRITITFTGNYRTISQNSHKEVPEGSIRTDTFG